MPKNFSRKYGNNLDYKRGIVIRKGGGSQNAKHFKGWLPTKCPRAKANGRYIERRHT